MRRVYASSVFGVRSRYRVDTSTSSIQLINKSRFSGPKPGQKERCLTLTDGIDCEDEMQLVFLERSPLFLLSHSLLTRDFFLFISKAPSFESASASPWHPVTLRGAGSRCEMVSTSDWTLDCILFYLFHFTASNSSCLKRLTDFRPLSFKSK